VLVSRDRGTRRRRMSDIYNLRLTSKTVGAVADAIFMEEILFFLCAKRDVDMVRSFADHPVYRNHPSTLALILNMMSRDRISHLEYTGAIRADMARIDATPDSRLRHVFLNKRPHMSEDEIEQDYHLYLRLFDEQAQILDNASEILKEFATKFENVRELVISANDHLRFARPPFKQCRYDDLSAKSRSDWNHLLDQTATLFRAFGESEKLHALQVGTIPFGFFDPIRCTAGKHCMMGNFATNITTFKLAILVYKDKEETVHPSALQVAEVEHKLGECRAVIGKGVLRAVLDAMPNLERLTVRFVEEHLFDVGTFAAPATLGSFISPNRVWPRLRYVAIDNVETDRHELASFIALNKKSLKTVALQSVRFATTSWMEFFPDLKSKLEGVRVAILLTRILRGRSEDGKNTVEGWDVFGGIGFEDYDDDFGALRVAITRYFISSKQDLRCPLTKSNMDWGAEAGHSDDYSWAS
jgi:hypothetical protein